MKSKLLLWTMTFAVILSSCRKDHMNPDPHTPPPASNRKILLKDIVEPHLPSPYYHYEYGADSLVAKVGFGDGFTNYDVIYSGGRISEMRNNIFVNHDTLRYIYDNAGNVAIVNYINDHNESYRHAIFTYNGSQVTKIEWDHKEGNVGFLIDRRLEFTYFPDGNLKEMKQHRSMTGTPDYDYITHFDNYDDKVAVDDNTIIHDGIHDHYLVLPNLHLQRNNHRKEWLTGAVSGYSINYTLTYNDDGTPKVRTGDFVYTSGNQNGQHFNVQTFYSYY